MSIVNQMEQAFNEGGRTAKRLVMSADVYREVCKAPPKEASSFLDALVGPPTSHEELTRGMPLPIVDVIVDFKSKESFWRFEV